MCCRYEKNTYDKWTRDVGEVAQQNLDKPLIIRDEQTLLIKVNFDPEVCVVIIAGLKKKKEKNICSLCTTLLTLVVGNTLSTHFHQHTVHPSIHLSTALAVH